MAQDPETIGRYRVLGPLGSGAMGFVYLAEDPLLKRRVAVKVVRGNQMGEEEALARFQREAEISAQLNHPNVITVHDVGEAEGLGPFIAMEYVDGRSLRRLIQEGAPNPETTMQLLLQGARALAAAARAGIVHRDVKPDNFLVGKDGRLKLMDFGIARGMESHLTIKGEYIGTPLYTAPELLSDGEPSTITDLYAFAVTAFELWTGRAAFQGGSLATLITQILHQTPVIPENLEFAVGQVLLRALSKDPSARYPDLLAFMGALVEASPLPPAVRLKYQSLLEDMHSADGDEVTLSGVRPVPAQASPSQPTATWTPDLEPGSNLVDRRSYKPLRIPTLFPDKGAILLLVMGGFADEETLRRPLPFWQDDEGGGCLIWQALQRAGLFHRRDADFTLGRGGYWDETPPRTVGLALTYAGFSPRGKTLEFHGAMRSWNIHRLQALIQGCYERSMDRLKIVTIGDEAKYMACACAYGMADIPILSVPEPTPEQLDMMQSGKDTPGEHWIGWAGKLLDVRRS